MQTVITNRNSMKEILSEFIVDIFVLLQMVVIGFLAEHANGIISLDLFDWTLLNIKAASTEVGVSVINKILPYLKATSLLVGLIYTSIKTYRMFKEGENKIKEEGK